MIKNDTTDEIFNQCTDDFTILGNHYSDKVLHVVKHSFENVIMFIVYMQ